jgi:hypothetical protein
MAMRHGPDRAARTRSVRHQSVVSHNGFDGRCRLIVATNLVHQAPLVVPPLPTPRAAAVVLAVVALAVQLALLGLRGDQLALH